MAVSRKPFGSASGEGEDRSGLVYYRRMVDLLFGNSYEAVLFVVAVIAAIPYGIYIGLKKVGSRITRGKQNGNPRTG